MHMALRGNFSVPVRVVDLVEASKDAVSLLVCTRKKFCGWGMRIFCESRHSGGFLGHLGPLCLALGDNR